MKITVWSILSGRLSGHLVLNVPVTQTVRKVLETYCSHKGASLSDQYVVRSKDNYILNLNKSLRQSKIDDGETLMIGLLDDEKQTFSFGSWWLVTLASFFIGFLGLGCILWLCLDSLSSALQYGIVIDAGSSHSQVFVFSWDGERPEGTADVKLVHQCFVAGGINTFASHVEDLDGYFGPCISEAKRQVPAAQHRHTTLYLKATAGMRILKDFDYEGAEAVLATIREIFLSYKTFQVDPENINILPASEEGTCGWIAVNYLAKHLKKLNSTTVSTLDVGGASMQVTSELTRSSVWPTMPITLFSHTHKVHSSSFLCYGISESQHRYNFFLINGNRTKEENDVVLKKIVTDPCLPSGVNHRVPLKQLSGPCTRTDDSLPLLSGISNISHSKMKRIFKNYRVTSNSAASRSEESHKIVNESFSGSVTVQGSSSAKECEENMHQLFNRALCETTFTYGDCMESESVPPIKGTLYAFSGLFRHLLQVLDIKRSTNLTHFKQVVFSVCSLDAAGLSLHYPELEKDIAEDLCFDGMYVYSLLTAGLGYNKSSWNNIVFSDEINKTEVVWPQGFMINSTTSLPPEVTSSPFSLLTLILMVSLFMAFISSGFLFLHHSLKIRRHSASYQRCIADHIDKELQRFIT